MAGLMQGPFLSKWSKAVVEKFYKSESTQHWQHLLNQPSVRRALSRGQHRPWQHGCICWFVTCHPRAPTERNGGCAGREKRTCGRGGQRIPRSRLTPELKRGGLSVVFAAVGGYESEEKGLLRAPIILWVPDPRLTGIPDKDDRSKNDRNSGTKDSGERRKVGGGRWSPTGDTTKTQGDRVPYATSKGSNPDETIKEERRARSSQGRIDQEHEYGESDKVKTRTPEWRWIPRRNRRYRSEYLHRSKVEWVKDGMKLKKDKSPNEDRSPVKIDPGLLEPEPELDQNWSGVGENGTGRNTVPSRHERAASSIESFGRISIERFATRPSLRWNV
ncbi:hypothetical protein FB45DRAFT_878210 [Roridomyces roridus]|uniref:Uncharacterized protein n=1 Tax=Roridomyces roridus TaxID=1738132 RepID=A0AAD7F971_9AGAR|nr:hypothetical protein FB45DRAFT_878210 [Roridomyces roridus]